MKKYILIILLLPLLSLQAQWTYIRGTSYPAFQIGLDGPQLRNNKTFLPAGYLDVDAITLRKANNNTFSSFVAKRLFLNNGDSTKFHFVVPVQDAYKDTNKTNKFVQFGDSAGTYFKVVSFDALVGDSLDIILDSLTYFKNKVTEHSTLISQNADNISLVAQDVLTLDTEVSKHGDTLGVYRSELNLNAHNITLKVSSTDYTGSTIVSKINIEPSSVKIASKNITFDGYAIFKALNGTNDSTTINGGKITTNTILADRIKVDSLSAIHTNLGVITAGTINAGLVNVYNISATKISTGTLSADRIAAGSLNGNKITANTILADRINVDSLSAIHTNLGVITAGTINAGLVNVYNINATKISTGTLSADRIAAGSLNGNKITSGTITTTELNFTPVTDDDVIASINASVEGITINASRINISGITTFLEKSTYLTAGQTTIDGGKITTSSITADKINTTGLIAESISTTTLDGITITGSEFYTTAGAIGISGESIYFSSNHLDAEPYGASFTGTLAVAGNLTMQNGTQVVSSSALTTALADYLLTSNFTWANLGGKPTLPTARGGEGAPAAGLGSANDTYYDSLNGKHYLKTDGGWIILN